MLLKGIIDPEELTLPNLILVYFSRIPKPYPGMFELIIQIFLEAPIKFVGPTSIRRYYQNKFLHFSSANNLKEKTHFITSRGLFNYKYYCYAAA